jgi:phosphodiesterase/alkaline phosphatase D-like protein
MIPHVLRIPLIGPLAIALVAVLLWTSLAAASTESRLPRSDYTVRAVCAAAARGRASCLSLQLVPRTAEARAHTHPLGVARATLRSPSAALSAAAGDFGVTPQDLHSAYQLPTSTSGTQTIALVDAYNDPNAEADLATYSKELGLPACAAAGGCFEKVNQDGETGNLPFPKTTKELESALKSPGAKRREAEEAIGWGLEISLDIETAHGVCQNCHILLVEANSPSFENLEAAEDTAARLGANEISDSWAGPECSEGFCVEDSSAFNHPGTVITAAAGDNGYLNWLEEPRSRYPDFPASSPQVVSVGGTRLSLGPNGEWAGETVWNDGGEREGVKDGYGATGGGCSTQFAAPPWQQDVSDWSTVGCDDKRAVADISADSDPYTGLAVFYSSPDCESAYDEDSTIHLVHWCTIGGTSLATPLIASTFALAGGAHGAAYPAKTLYEGAAGAPESLHDVTEGSNGECLSPFDEATGLQSCTPAQDAATGCASAAICMSRTGYDGPTGLGTPDGVAAFTPRPRAPTVVTDSASSIKQTSATLGATVDPNGREVSACELQYGPTIVYAFSAPCSPPPGSGTSAVTVSAPITGLSANTTYHFRVVATNVGGTSEGSDQVFKTLPNPPTVTTDAASSITQTAATLNASVNPNGGEVSECKLEYGTSVSYQSSVPCSPSPGASSRSVAVSASVTGLLANSTYHFRVVATNSGGTSRGSDETLTTQPPSQTPNAPSATTGSASSVTQTSATLNATVNPDGEEVKECRLEYGTTIPYTLSASCSPQPGSGTSPVAVSAQITSLTANTTYHYRVVAVSAADEAADGNDQTFKTPPDPPLVSTDAASSVTQTTATLNASVNPNSSEVTECKLEYGTTVTYESSAACTPSPGSGGNPVNVSASLTGLMADTTYHYRVVATNAGGTSEGTDDTFTTQLPTALQQQLPGQQPTSQSQASSTTSGSEGVSASQERNTPTVPDADLASTSLRESSSGTVNVAVRCPADESSCTGTVTLRKLRVVRISNATANRSKNSKTTVLTLCTGSFKVAGGKLTTIRLHLSSAARALLAHTRLLYARAAIFARDHAGATHTAQMPVTIRAYRRSVGGTA